MSKAPYVYSNFPNEIANDTLESSFKPLPVPGTPEDRVYHNMIEASRATVRNLVPWVFALHTVETDFPFGDIIGIAADSLKTGLFMGASGANSFVPPLVGLIPLPLAGTVGIFVGWLVSIGFLGTYVLISFSQREFTDVGRGILAMVPVAGNFLTNTFQSSINMSTRLANRYEKVSFQLAQLMDMFNKAIAKTYVDLKVMGAGNPKYQGALNALQGFAQQAPQMANQVRNFTPSLPMPMPRGGRKTQKKRRV